MNHGEKQAEVSSAQLAVLGQFDLEHTIGFGFGQRDAAVDGVMRLAFCLDGYEGQVGVVVRQPEPQRLDLEIHADPGTDLDAVTAQVARVLSVDVDARPYDELAERDSIVGQVRRAKPGLRPPLFYSAYEAALWAVLSARQPHARMSQVRDQLSREHGRVFELAGRETAAVPLPHQLLGVQEFIGLFPAKGPRMHAVAQAALDGRLDTGHLRELEPAQTLTELQKLPGLGPFYSELVLIRALGHTDLLPTKEPRARRIAGALTGADAELPQAEFEALAKEWRPWRTWVVVGMRAGLAASETST